MRPHSFVDEKTLIEVFTGIKRLATEHSAFQQGGQAWRAQFQVTQLECYKILQSKKDQPSCSDCSVLGTARDANMNQT